MDMPKTLVGSTEKVSPAIFFGKETAQTMDAIRPTPLVNMEKMPEPGRDECLVCLKESNNNPITMA